MLKLIAERSNNSHVSLDTVLEFEEIILSDPRVTAEKPAHKFIADSTLNLWRILRKLHPTFKKSARFFFSLINNSKKQSAFFVVLIGINIPKCMPYVMLNCKKGIYIFDLWPNSIEYFKEFIHFWDIDYIFVTASQSAERLKQFLPNCSIHWVPEGIAPEKYRHVPYKDKDIHVLQLGRKHDAYHNLIVESLELQHKIYLYEKIKGQIIFPTREGFIDGLARTKISICIPSNITHPERAGDIETMTIRYLQSIVSKCLIIGHAPKEMVDLFGYNPVIEIDNHDPQGQLKQALDHFEEYIPLIEKNFSTVVNSHTWRHRWDRVSKVLFPDD